VDGFRGISEVMSESVGNLMRRRLLGAALCFAVLALGALAVVLPTRGVSASQWPPPGLESFPSEIVTPPAEKQAVRPPNTANGQNAANLPNTANVTNAPNAPTQQNPPVAPNASNLPNALNEPKGNAPAKLPSHRKPPGPIQPEEVVRYETPALSRRRDQPREALFWRVKPEIYRKITEERAVVVSVTRTDLKDEPGMIHFAMKGAGIVGAPKNFSFRTAQEYEKLKQISDHFRTVVFDPNSRRLFLIMEALGYQARMVLQITPVSEDWRSEIQWQVIWGAFKGMTGVIGFEHEGSDRCEISLISDYKSDHLPLPKVLMGFTLEVLTQKVAEKMRTFIETEYKAARRSAASQSQ
jgi:hypothetical protein